ncbi:dehydrogenase pkfF [Physcia stellaris]|nr:dehydrogenase pkfF [Physcia stellaris]
MVSGIGPRKTLETLNITVLSDLPGVGQNLWDQVYYGASFRVNVETSSCENSDKVYAAQVAQDYLNNQTGPLTSVGGFFDSTDWPEIEYLVENSFDGNNSELHRHRSERRISICHDLLRSGCPAFQREHPADIEIAIVAFKRVRELWTLMNGTTIGEEYFPGTASVSTDEEILDFIRGGLITLWHAAGTCKMGKDGDADAVVDNRARVKGVSGLRVVDASVFPLLPPGHPQATVYAIAEKIAEDILMGR